MRSSSVINDGFDAQLDELRGLQNNCGAFQLALEAREALERLYQLRQLVQ